MRLSVGTLDRRLSRRARRYPAGATAHLAAKLASPWAAAAEGILAGAFLRATGRPALGVAAGPSAAVVLVKGLKRAIDRPRPLRKRFRANGSESFPSSHVAGPAALVGAAWAQCSPRARVVLAAGLGVFLATIGLERLRGSDHWPSDLVAGTAMGLGIGALTARLCR